MTADRCPGFCIPCITDESHDPAPSTPTPAAPSAPADRDEEYVQAIEKLDQARRDNSRLKAANEALRESERAKQTVINDLQGEMAVTQEERNDLWNSQKSLALENATLQVKVRELTLALDKALRGEGRSVAVAPVPPGYVHRVDDVADTGGEQQ